MDTATSAERLAVFVAGLRLEDLPPTVREAARLHMIDAVGCSIAAVGTGEGCWAAEVLGRQGGTPEAIAVGCAEALPAPSAAMVNGVFAHSLDFDDTHGPSVCHVSAVVAPAALAVAQAEGANGSELLVSFVAGAECVCRIGMAAPGAFHARGFHSSSVCGVFGATVAAARLMGLEETRIVSAIGIAGSFASGLLAFLSDGSQTKPLHAGWAAQAGVQAARLAGAGAEGPAAVLEDGNGLFAAFAGGAARLERLEDLGLEWEMPRISFKAYPACHFVHASVDAAAEALAALCPATPADIAAVDVRVSDTGVGLVLDPIDEKLTPRTPYDAKFSLPFCVASRLVHGVLDLSSFTPARLREKAVLDLAQRFRYTSWSVAEAPAPFAGEATVRLADGRESRERVDHPRGSIENPIGPAAVEAKFRSNARTALEDSDVEALLAGLAAVDEQPRLDDLLAPLAIAAPREAVEAA